MVLLMLALIPVNIFVTGFVVSYLWLWFLVPLGLPVISLAHAFGIAVFAEALTFKLDQGEDNNDKDRVIVTAARSLVTAACMMIMLFVGWCAAWFM